MEAALGFATLRGVSVFHWPGASAAVCALIGAFGRVGRAAIVGFATVTGVMVFHCPNAGAIATLVGGDFITLGKGVTTGGDFGGGMCTILGGALATSGGFAATFGLEGT